MINSGTAPDHSTILVAERGNRFRRFPHYLLRNAGYCPVAASHGYEALYMARLHSSTLRLLIVEANLPFIGGWELAARIEALNPKIKTILLMPAEVAGGSGNLMFLPENAVPERILSTVRTLLAPPRRRVSTVPQTLGAFDPRSSVLVR